MRLSTIALLAFGVSSQYKPKCEVPEQLEGRYTEFDPNSRTSPWNRTLEYYATGKFYYDAKTEQKAEFEERKDCLEDNDLCKETDYVGWIYKAREQRAYVLNLGKKGEGPVTCTGYYEIHEPFTPFAPAANSTFLGHLTEGAYPEELPAMEYSSKIAFRDGTFGTRIQEFAEDGYGSCVPMRDDTFSHDMGYTYRHYYDMTIGISDPNVFYPDVIYNCQPFPPPGSKSMLEVAEEVGAGQFAKLVSSVKAVQAKISQQSGITVLAPSDDAIKKAASTISSLTSAQVEQVLLYHISSAYALAKDLKDKEVLKTDDGKQEVMVHLKGNKVYFSGGTKNSMAEVIKADNLARNGVLHLIDELLIPAKFN